MGHVRLGRLPNTHKWQEVVGLVEAGAGTAEVAAATLDASQRGLLDVANDPALVCSFWLLTQLPLCARQPNFVQALAQVGISVSREPGVMDLVGGLSDAVDDHVFRFGGRTDLGEMAQIGASEALTATLRQRTASLFETTPDDVRRELAHLATPKNFSILARDFFARLTEKHLAYFLSRELSNSLPSVAANSRFREALSIHCRQASKILEQFAADWFSQANYRGGITPRKAAGFIGYAITKLNAELRKAA